MDDLNCSEIKKLIKEKFPIAIDISRFVPTFLIGGALRDTLEGKVPNDLDFVVLDKSDEVIKFFIDSFELKYKINKLGGYKIFYNDTVIDLWNTCDLFNAIQYNIEGLFYDVNSGYFLPFGYYDALKNGLREINPSDNIQDNEKKLTRKLKLEDYIKNHN